MLKAAVYPVFGRCRHIVRNGLRGVEHGAYRAAGYLGRGEHFFAIVLTGEVDGGFHHFVRFLGGADGDGHNDTSTNEEEVHVGKVALTGEHVHDERLGRSFGVVCEVEERFKAGQRSTYEVHKVVAGKGHGQGEGTEEHHKLEDVDLEEMEEFHEHGEHHKAATEYGQTMGVDPVGGPPDGGEERGLAESAHEEKVEDGGDAQSAKDGYAVAKVLLIMERKYHTGYPHDNESYHEGDGHGKENADNHGEGLVGVDEVGIRVSAAYYLRHGESRATAHEAENHRHSGGCGHTERVEDVEQDDVRGGHTKEDAHHIVERIIMGVEDAMTGNVHHASARTGSHKDADGGNDENGSKLCGFCAHCRAKEVDSVICHTYREVERGKNNQEQ